jgi:non-specific serine/threonine protein kinase
VIQQARPVEWLTGFVGRESALAEVTRLITESQLRLVTLTGPGGIGKTRLARRAADDLAGVFEDGAWWVELAPLESASLVLPTVAQIVRASERPGERAFDSLIDRLRERHALLVLDNCEHVLDGCTSLVFELLRACPRLTVLATSREPLDVPGETTWRVPPLNVPDADVTLGTDELAGYDAVRLLIERGRAVRSEFALTDTNATAVAQVVRRLDGIPLAIELAAARLRVLTPQEVAARLDDRFSLLTSGSKLALPRQQTLRATVDWSFRLLSEPERLLFARLSVFAGGWTLDAAHAVCELADDTLDVLTRLVDRSLVQVEQHAQASRYRLLETLREYAHERLTENGNVERMRDRHASYFLSRAQDTLRESRGRHQPAYFDALEQDHDNIRAALRWTTEHGPIETALLLCNALSFFWAVRGYRREGREWLELALARADGAPAQVRATAIAWIGYLSAELGEGDRAASCFEASLALRTGVGDSRGIARVLESYGYLERLRGRTQHASELLEQSLELRREIGDSHGIAHSVRALGQLAWAKGDYEQAEKIHTEAYRLMVEVDDLHDATHELVLLAEAVGRRGERDRAYELNHKAIETFRELRDNDGMAAALNNLSVLEADAGRWSEAAQLGQEALRLFFELGATWGVVVTLESMAAAAVGLGEPRSAARWLGTAETLRLAIDFAGSPPMTERRLATAHSARAAIGDQAFDAAWAAGQDVSASEALKEIERFVARVSGDMPPTHTAAPFGLTRRESEVAELLAQGLSNREIAQALVLSERTVETHVTHLLGKLGVRSRAQAAVRLTSA